ncbi:hypothetical protein N7470_004911 [Penicillium chermesinum]|nr:hypothetical protein N7470_004911 [Penicillium chermesinum]
MPERIAHSRGSSFADSIDGMSFPYDNPLGSPSSRFDGNTLPSTRSSRGSSTTSLSGDQPRRRSTLETLAKPFTSPEEKSSSGNNIAAATAAAKKWGAPLPRPDRYALKRNSNSGTLPKRKPVALPPQPDPPSTGSHRPVPPPPLPHRKRLNPGASSDSNPDGNADEVLVVEAPQDSARPAL